jgi:RimJ/RimL family protein N-acetyltransferase
MIPLSTQRLLLRRFRPGDEVALAAYRSDPEIARFQSWSVPVSVQTARSLVDESAGADPRQPGWFQYGIEHKKELIGDVGVNMHENGMHAEIGFTLAAAYQGRGFGTEAVRAVVDHLFTERGLHRVSAECDARNLRSARLLARVGFRHEGQRRAHTWLKGEWTDDLLFGLLSYEWPPAGNRPS